MLSHIAITDLQMALQQEFGEVWWGNTTYPAMSGQYYVRNRDGIIAYGLTVREAYEAAYITYVSHSLPYRRIKL